MSAWWREANGLAGTRRPDVPLYMRLYPDSEHLKWTGNALIVRQRDFHTRSPLVHLLFQQLRLVIRFATQYDGTPEEHEVEDLIFSLDASAPVDGNTRVYVFDLEFPLAGRVRLEEVLDYGRHRWRHYITVRGQVTEVREVSDSVSKHAGTEERRLVDGRELRITHGRFERELDI